MLVPPLFLFSLSLFSSRHIASVITEKRYFYTGLIICLSGSVAFGIISIWCQSFTVPVRNYLIYTSHFLMHSEFVALSAGDCTPKAGTKPHGLVAGWSVPTAGLILSFSFGLSAHLFYEGTKEKKAGGARTPGSSAPSQAGAAAPRPQNPAPRDWWGSYS